MSRKTAKSMSINAGGMVLHNYTRPPHWKRFLAFAADAVIAAGPVIATSIFILYPYIAVAANLEVPSLYDNAAIFYIIDILFYLSIPWFLFFSLCRDGFGGRSPGKRIFGLAVVNLRNGNPCSINLSALRNLLMVLISIFHWLLPLLGLVSLLIEPIAVVTNAKGMRISDRWSKTQVVEVLEQQASLAK